MKAFASRRTMLAVEPSGSCGGWRLDSSYLRTTLTKEDQISDRLLDSLFIEYERLKAEQVQRIGFRDNLLYANLLAIGGIVSFAVGDQSRSYAILVIPWVCIVLGWTYVVNDEKISAIGDYIRIHLAKRMGQHVAGNYDEPLFGWEIFHRTDKRRLRRKLQQLVVDQLTFVASGLLAIVVFYATGAVTVPLSILCWTEALLIIYLGYEIYRYADLAVHVRQTARASDDDEPQCDC